MSGPIRVFKGAKESPSFTRPWLAGFYFDGEWRYSSHESWLEAVHAALSVAPAVRKLIDSEWWLKLPAKSVTQ